jgi:ATP-dependent helicase/nuclease subunit B
MATKRLILVAPRQEGAEVIGPHPLRDRLTALFGKSVQQLEQSDTEWLQVSAGSCCLSSVEIHRRDLPRPQRFWSVPPAYLQLRPVESYSSLVTLFQEPFRWVLTYSAKLKEGPIQAIGNQRTLMGNLAHRLFEELFTPGETCAGWTEKKVSGKIDTLLACLLPQEGAVFLLPGHGSARREFERKSRASAIEMARHIHENGWRVVGTERPVEGTLGDQAVAGFVDLLLEKDDGSYAVVDLKWTAAHYLRRNLTENRSYQLALYAQMLKKKMLPHVAYFSLPDAQLIAPDARAFKGARIAELAEDESLLKAMGETFRFRRQQLEKGLIEVPVSGTVLDPTVILPAGCLVDPGETKAPGEFLALVGWGVNSHE